MLAGTVNATACLRKNYHAVAAAVAAATAGDVVVVVILYCHDGPWPIRHIEF